MKQENAIEENFWRYVRGELDEAAFEAWVYATPELEATLGWEDFHAVASCDYRDTSGNARFKRTGMARDIVTRCFPRACVCRATPDVYNCNLGSEKRPLEEHLDIVSQRNPWISFQRCRECGMHWLIGYDTVDDWVFARRLTTDAAQDILIRDRWPTVFDDNPNLWGTNRYEIIRGYEEAIRRNPDDADAYYRLGVCHSDKYGDNAKAFYNFDQAIRLRPDLAPAYACRGDCYMIMADVDAALHDYDRAIALDNNQTSARVARAAIHRQRRNFRKTLEDCDYVLVRSPRYARALMERGMAYAGLGKLDRAISDFDRAIELAQRNGLDPVAVEALVNRGMAHAAERRYPAAIADFDATLCIDPRHVLALCNRAGAKLRNGDEAGGNADLAAARQIDAARTDAWLAAEARSGMGFWRILMRRFASWRGTD